MPRTVLIAAAALLAGSLAVTAQTNTKQTSDTAPQVLKGKAAFGDWNQDRPGVRRHITPADLPAIEKQSSSFAEVVLPPADAKPRLPPGFTAETVVTGLEGARVLKFAPNGDLFVAEKPTNTVRVLRLQSGSAKPIVDQVFAADLHQPYGIAFYPAGPTPEWIYIANSDGVVRIPYKVGDLKASGAPETVIKRIPWQHHWTRDIVFTPDGARLLLAVGSGSNVALDMSTAPREKGGLEAWKNNKPLGAPWDTEERRATVLSFDPNGKNEKIFATGLRNCSGITIQPATREPWCVVNERDGLGDNTPFEYATSVKEGAFYGWPWFYIGANEDPRQKDARPDLKDKVTMPDVLIQAHSAPLQIVFYEGDNFPAAYKGSAFVTLHGSWDRSKRTGYKVVRLLFDQQGKPTGEYEDFMTGFVISDKQVWARPVGLAVAQDGALFVSEDGNGTIWRVTHQRSASR